MIRTLTFRLTFFNILLSQEEKEITTDLEIGFTKSKGVVIN